jgi:hypothetical protein
VIHIVRSSRRTATITRPNDEPGRRRSAEPPNLAVDAENGATRRLPGLRRPNSASALLVSGSTSGATSTTGLTAPPSPTEFVEIVNGFLDS